MVIVGIALWLWWHVVQLRSESEELEADLAKYGSAEQVKKALDRDH